MEASSQAGGYRDRLTEQYDAAEAQLADSDEAAHAFQFEAGHLFRSQAGRIPI